MTKDFDSYPVAAKMRDLVRRIADREIDRKRPPDRTGILTSYDPVTKRAQVLFPGETSSVSVNVTEVSGLVLEQPVRVSGQIGDRYILAGVDATATPPVGGGGTTTITGGGSIVVAAADTPDQLKQYADIVMDWPWLISVMGPTGASVTPGWEGVPCPSGSYLTYVQGLYKGRTVKCLPGTYYVIGPMMLMGGWVEGLTIMGFDPVKPILKYAPNNPIANGSGIGGLRNFNCLPYTGSLPGGYQVDPDPDWPLFSGTELHNMAILNPNNRGFKNISHMSDSIVNCNEYGSAVPFHLAYGSSECGTVQNVVFDVGLSITATLNNATTAYFDELLAGDTTVGSSGLTFISGRIADTLTISSGVDFTTIVGTRYQSLVDNGTNTFVVSGGGGGGGGGGASALPLLSDVDDALSPSSGDYFSYDGTKWTSVAKPSSADITDSGTGRVSLTGSTVDANLDTTDGIVQMLMGTLTNISSIYFPIISGNSDTSADADYTFASGPSATPGPVRLLSMTGLTAARTVNLRPVSDYATTALTVTVIDGDGSCSGTETITLNPDGTETIDGNATRVLNTANAKAVLVADPAGGGNWLSII